MTRRRPNRPLVLGIVAALGAVAVATMATYSIFGRVDVREQRAAARADARKSMVANAAAAFATLPMEDVRHGANVESLRRQLADSTVVTDGETTISPAELSELWSAAAEALHVIFVNQDLDTYLAWRRSGGYELHTDEHLKDVIGVGLYYKFYLGKDLPKETSVGEAFKDLWQQTHAGNAPQAKVVGIASGARGLAASVGTLQPSRAIRSGNFGGLGREIWVGDVASTSPSWFVDRSKAASTQPIVYADVGAIMEFQNGTRRPVVLTFYREAAPKKWRLQFINQYNYRDSDCSVLIY